MQRVALVVFALWIGAVAAVALVVTPRVFSFLDDNRKAGDLMLVIFNRVDYFGLVAAALFAFAARASRWRLLLSIGLWLAAAVNVFVASPRIAARGENFDLFHDLATGLWSVILIGGIVLLAAGQSASSSRST